MTKVRVSRELDVCPPLLHALAYQPSTRSPLSSTSSFAAASPSWTTGPTASAFRALLHVYAAGCRQQSINTTLIHDC
jgi:hypothetical protein